MSFVQSVRAHLSNWI